MQHTLRRFLPLLPLAALMALTRLGHQGMPWSLPDASWAVFFLGGLYLPSAWRWALPLLLAMAVGLDVLAIRVFGVDNLCVTLAYWCTLPAYALLWWGGTLARGHASGTWRSRARLAAALVLSISACYLFTNATFYWFGGRVVRPDLAGWLDNLATWYLPFLITPVVYVLAVMLARAAWSTSTARWQPMSRDAPHA